MLMAFSAEVMSTIQISICSRKRLMVLRTVTEAAVLQTHYMISPNLDIHK